jgi:hypothetical protein
MPVPAGIIGDFLKTALIALFNMSTKRCCAARLNMAHDFKLLI